MYFYLLSNAFGNPTNAFSEIKHFRMENKLQNVKEGRDSLLTLPIYGDKSSVNYYL